MTNCLLEIKILIIGNLTRKSHPLFCALLLTLFFSVSSSIAYSTDIPDCQSHSSDSDNDGWGWENNRSCLVDQSLLIVETAPLCEDATSDSDNDDWGWENNQSCLISKAQPASGTPLPCDDIASDSDNDGWGWENNRSCIINKENPTVVVQQTTEPPVLPQPVTARKIMAVGDSITHGVGNRPSYRQPFKSLLDQHSCKYVFVGSQTTNRGNGKFTSPHESYSGHHAHHFLNGLSNASGNNRGITNSMHKYNPDIVLLHIGTNDLYNGQSAGGALSEIDQIIAAIHTVNANTIVLLANVIPIYRKPAQQEVEKLASKIKAYVNQLANPKVKLVDVQSGYSTSMNYDGIHPNALGEAHIADAYFDIFETTKLCAR